MILDMGIRKNKIVAGEIYHVYNRAGFRQQIFHDREDYNRFIFLIHLANGQKRFKFKDIKKYQKDILKLDIENRVIGLLSYTIMPNHFHFMVLVNTPVPDGGGNKEFLSVFMQKVCAGYSMYYNRKYGKTGSVFEGRYKIQHVATQEYLKYLFAYIHLNPIKLLQGDWKEIGITDPKRAKDFLEGYEYSSFVDYFVDQNRRKGKILDKESFYKKIENSTDLQKDMLEWLNYGKMFDLTWSQYLE